MSEYNRSRRPDAEPGSSDSRDTRAYPDDFTPDESAFADALRDLFPSDQEELPPLFVQTLLEDEARSSTVPGYEAKVLYRVFRRLRLPLPPLSGEDREGAPSRTLRAAGRGSRPLAGLIGALLCVIIASVVLATPSFAAGLRLLIGHTGIAGVEKYPQHVSSPKVAVTPPNPANLTPDPSMPLYWLGDSITNYTYEGTQIMPQEQWSKGPVVDVQYWLPGSTVGSGVIDIREFQVSPRYAAVLQVVQSDSASSAQVGDLPGVYVNGSWIRVGLQKQWQYGVRSELIFERDGVIFWVVADQRDGMGEQQLLSAVSHLQPVDYRMLKPRQPNLRLIGHDLSSSLHNAAGLETYALVPVGVSPDSDLSRFVLADDSGGGTQS